MDLPLYTHLPIYPSSYVSINSIYSVQIFLTYPLYLLYLVYLDCPIDLIYRIQRSMCYHRNQTVRINSKHLYNHLTAPLKLQQKSFLKKNTHNPDDVKPIGNDRSLDPEF